MNTPKLLPWYARKTGVALDRAEALWRESLRDAREKAGRRGDTEYSGEAMQGFIELLECERETARVQSDVFLLVRNQSRPWNLALSLMEALLSRASAHWQRQMINWRCQMNPTLRRIACRTPPAFNSR